MDIDIDLETAVTGGSKKIRIQHNEKCTTCSGSGAAPGTKAERCAECNGQGVVIQVAQTILGRVQQQVVCPSCGGEGTRIAKRCGACDGKGVKRVSKQLTVDIPVGIDEGNRLRVKGEGDAGMKGGPAGDLYIFVNFKKDSRFKREGMEIKSKVKISYLDAILGATIKVPTVDGQAELKVPAGTQPGMTLRIPGRGMPKLGQKNTRGNHNVEINVEIPKDLSSKQKELVKQLKEIS